MLKLVLVDEIAECDLPSLQFLRSLLFSEIVLFIDNFLPLKSV